MWYATAATLHWLLLAYTVSVVRRVLRANPNERVTEPPMAWVAAGIVLNFTLMCFYIYQAAN